MTGISAISRVIDVPSRMTGALFPFVVSLSNHDQADFPPFDRLRTNGGRRFQRGQKLISRRSHSPSRLAEDLYLGDERDIRPQNEHVVHRVYSCVGASTPNFAPWGSVIIATRS